MAKTQTFGDKLKKKDAKTTINVKVIKGYRSEKGTVKFLERFVRVNDIAETEKLDIGR